MQSPPFDTLPTEPSPMTHQEASKAADGTRTHDLVLTKDALYQLSYSSDGQSGRRESNPHNQLGRLGLYH